MDGAPVCEPVLPPRHLARPVAQKPPMEWSSADVNISWPKDPEQ